MEKHYSIDPGKGTKMDGCPYSVYEDGHDVQDYIVAPKGYVFVGFKFETLTNNQIYDGKLVAQYEKTSIQERLTSNLWKILIPVIIVAAIGIVVVLAVSVFRSTNPGNHTPKQSEPEIVATTKDTLSADTQKAPAVAETPTKEETDTTLHSTDNNGQQDIAQTNTKGNSTSLPDVNDPNVQFKKKFWTLIHQRTIMMDPYDELFKENKNKVEGEEYDYLRFTILKDYATFKEWYLKLHKVPVAELENINTINDLKNKLNTIE